MSMKSSRIALCLAAIALIVFDYAPSAPATATATAPSAPDANAVRRTEHRVHPECSINLDFAGTMAGIVSNALVRGLKCPADDVRAFLTGAPDRYASGADLLKAAAAHFKVREDVLAAKVEKYKHCNCKHPVDNPLHPHLHNDPHSHRECTIDLTLAGTMSDVVSNALCNARQIPERTVRAFLSSADDRFEDGPEVFKTAAVHFKITEDILAADVQRFRHTNCTHARADGTRPAVAAATAVDDGAPVPAFARNVTLHVVLHELGHALIREFDIPILGNEETMAEAFATYYLTTYLPDRAVDVLAARVTSLMIEAGESAVVNWSGEHDHDARRAYQIAAFAVAADAVKYRPVAAIVGMSNDDIRKAQDYGGEIRRSWRRVLAPLTMPAGVESAEARVLYDAGNGFLKRLCADGLAREIESAVKRFDWHSQVTIRFVDGEGGAAWSRSGRAITVHSAYVRRFIAQGRRGLPVGTK